MNQSCVLGLLWSKPDNRCKPSSEDAALQMMADIAVAYDGHMGGNYADAFH